MKISSLTVILLYIYIIISIYFFIISFFYHPYSPMLYDSEDWTHILEMHIMRRRALIGIAVATFFIYFIKETGENSVIPLFFILIFLTVIILFIIFIIDIYIFITSFLSSPFPILYNSEDWTHVLGDA